MKCPRCQQDSSPNANFCMNCGTPLNRTNDDLAPGMSYRELEQKVEYLTRAISEAREQQTATSEILRVISSSPTDLTPVFTTIVANATRLCEAQLGNLFLYDAAAFHAVAHHNASQPFVDILRGPLRPGPETGVQHWLRELRPFQIADVRLTRPYEASEPYAVVAADLEGIRTLLGVPLVKENRPVGVITIYRREVRPFTDNQIDLVKTFADQAVIAIQNVRLFNELEVRNKALTEALDQQTATSEILRVISSSPTDVQPVFDAIASSAARLCDAVVASVWRRDADRLYIVAHSGSADGLVVPAVELGRSVAVDATTVNGRCAVEARAVHVEDLQAAALDFPEGSALARRLGHRTQLSVPLLRDGNVIGTIALRRAEVRLFSDKQIALLQTFADQAVIAIENVRLFTELQERNRALTAAHAQVTEALEQQTATAEILRVISSSPTDVQPVFDTIVSSAVRLCDGLYSGLYQFDGELIHQVAQHNFTPEALAAAHRIFPARPSRAMGSGRAILECAVVHIPDVEVDPEYHQQTLSRAIGFRSGLYVPMLREGAPIGVIVVGRAEPGPFSDSQVELLKTFADQAVIAVENVRLFKELQSRTGELTRSVEQLTALGEVSRAVSSTLDVETVLDTIVSRATQLAGADGCAIYEYDDTTEAFHVRATHSVDPALVETLRAMPLRKGEGVMGRATETREPIQLADIAAPGVYQSHLRDVLIGAGYRALLSVPLLREDQIIGSLSLNRKAPGEFPPEVIDVLKTFATQSALAIQNARLFREIDEKSRQLEVASQHKSEFLANMSHQLRTPLNAIIGFSEVLSEGMFGDINEKQTEYLGDILESGQHLLSLINDILDLSKIEAGRMELESTEFDLRLAIENAVILVRERAVRRGVALQRTVEEGLGQITGDERKVKQVLLNLLSNALKFTPEGGRIDVRAGIVDGVAEISVTDTGVGIAPEDQEAVFEEFRQVGGAEKKAEGTGLGLALCRKFVELHGGRISVRSEVGAGSTFTFTLPLLRPGP